MDQKLYELATKHRRNFSESNLKSDGYKMPEAYDDENCQGISNQEKKMQVVNKRYEEEKTNLTEQEMWERDQQKKTIGQVGARDKTSRKHQKNYELLMENQVDFVQSSLLEGVLD